MFTKDTFKVEDMVQVYLNDDKAKCGTQFCPRIVLSVNQEDGSVVVPGRRREHISAAFEDTHAVHVGCALSNLVQSAIDELDESVSELLDVSAECGTHCLHSSEANIESAKDVCDFFSVPPVRPDTGARVDISGHVTTSIMLYT